MSVAQLTQHVAQHLKELVLRHEVINLRGITRVHLVPVNTQGLLLLRKEAIMFIHHLPQRLEVATRRVRIFVLVNTRGERQRG